MTHTILSRFILSMAISLVVYPFFAGVYASTSVAESTSKEARITAADETDKGKKIPYSAEAPSNTPHAKSQVPQMEELPHIHHFHKERVKKIKKHHGKYWMLSQVLLVLCHISILIIGFLHATH